MEGRLTVVMNTAKEVGVVRVLGFSGCSLSYAFMIDRGQEYSKEGVVFVGPMAQNLYVHSKEHQNPSVVYTYASRQVLQHLAGGTNTLVVIV